MPQPGAERLKDPGNDLSIRPRPWPCRFGVITLAICRQDGAAKIRRGPKNVCRFRGEIRYITSATSQLYEASTKTY